MPDNSWCTSLIGGQKHELPLVVFTVIEEIYRRGELALAANHHVGQSVPVLPRTTPPSNSLLLLHRGYSSRILLLHHEFASHTPRPPRAALITRNVPARNLPTRRGRYPNLSPHQSVQYATPLRRLPLHNNRTNP
jgi:hypothetical protein